MKKAAEKINRIVLKVVAAGFILSLAIISLQVFLRYLFNYSLPWGEELARYLNIFVVLLGSSVVFAEDEHPRIETFYEALGARWQRILNELSRILISGFLVVLVWQGISLCLFSWEDYTSALRVRWTFPYLCIPLGGILMLFQLLFNRRNSRNQGL